MYTHYLPKIIGYKAYMKVHIIVLILSAIVSFLLFKVKPFTVNTNAPTLDIIFILLTTIGLPFFVLSTSSTNFQKWYSLTRKENPYHLYSLSNTGNLLALISYGLAIEVLFGLRDQILAWNILYASASIIGVFIGIQVYNDLNVNKFDAMQKEIEKNKKEKTEPKRKMYWLLLSFIPCSLMIATNTVLGNRVNVASIRYYWILPLSIYLIAYIIAFSKIKLPSVNIFEKLTFWLVVIILGIFFMGLNMPIYIISMIVLFMVSLICNIYMVRAEPNESNLTEFYLYIAIGGALGGIFGSLISPMLFNNVYEYPITVIMFLFLMFFKHKMDKVEIFEIESWEYLILFLTLFCIVITTGISKQLLIYFSLLFLTFFIRMLYVNQKNRVLSLAILIILTSSFDYVVLQSVDCQVRNFYGIKTVTTSDYVDSKGDTHKLTNLYVGNTLHGSQFTSGDKYEFNALTYYDKEGSTIGRFFTQNKDKIKNVGAVGLGVGILSAVSDEHQAWKYFEIDPQVTALANNKKYFTIMDKYKPQIITGDARITLQLEKDKYYDVLVLDAYSGDIVPASLLTKEAVELYKNKLTDDGILLFHITNRQFNLKPVLSTVSEVIGMDCYIDTSVSKGTVVPAESVWVMMTNNKNLIADSWIKIEKYPNFRLWTDDKYSITTVLKK